jgi:hypothetical protein
MAENEQDKSELPTQFKLARARSRKRLLASMGRSEWDERFDDKKERSR